MEKVRAPSYKEETVCFVIFLKRDYPYPYASIVYSIILSVSGRQIIH